MNYSVHTGLRSFCTSQSHVKIHEKLSFHISVKRLKMGLTFNASWSTRICVRNIHGVIFAALERPLL